MPAVTSRFLKTGTGYGRTVGMRFFSTDELGKVDPAPVLAGPLALRNRLSTKREAGEKMGSKRKEANSFETELANLWGEEFYRVLGKVRVGLAGAGGLGSNCAAYLVRTGFRRLRVVDFDRVSPANLNRQFYFQEQVGMEKAHALRENLLRINPSLELEPVVARVGRENFRRLFADCDILVEAFDDPGEKQALTRLFFDLRAECSRPYLLVAASGVAGWGASDAIRCRKVLDCFYLVGDEKTAVGKEHPPLAPRVNVAAAKQADLVLDFVYSNRHLWEKANPERRWEEGG